MAATRCRTDRGYTVSRRTRAQYARSLPAGAGCANAPVLLYLHGNEWSKGHKRQQALPLLHQLAALGWVVVAPNYRLSPGVRFPAQLIDCKSAFAWVRAHVAAYGGDPHWVAVAGGSTGAHLAALIALTHDIAELQPGFEHVNTKPAACVTLYGAYDFTDRHGCRRDGKSYVKWLGANIMPCPLDRDPAAWESASPMPRYAPTRHRVSSCTARTTPWCPRARRGHSPSSCGPYQ